MAKAKPPVEKPYLFVDLSNLVYKNSASLHFLRTPDGLATGGVFGTIRNLLSWSQKFKVWVFVDGYGSQRRDLIKGYKTGRKDSLLPSAAPKDPSELRGARVDTEVVDEVAHWVESQEQFSALEAQVVQEFNPVHESLKQTVYGHIAVLTACLPNFGFPVVFHSEFEADDLIGATVFLRERAVQAHFTLPEVYI